MRPLTNRLAAACFLALSATTIALAPAQPAAEPPAEQPAQPSKPQPTDPPTTPAPAPPSDGSLTDQNVDRMIRDLERSARTPRSHATPSAEPGPAPANAPRAARTGSVTPAKRAKSLPEGTFLPSRRGRIVRSDTGDWTFVFDADAQGQADPPMTLLPCAKLMQMEDDAARLGEAATFIVSGQVFLYRGRNYLLPTVHRTERENKDILPTQ